jgi:ribosomal protein S18 acetylase RimI-like enzyme
MARPVVRGVSLADLEALLALWQAASLQLSASDTPAGLARKLERDPDLFLTVEEEGQLVAAVMGAYDGRRGWVYHLAVHPNRQGHHLGTLLMEELERRLRARGCATVNLLIEPENAGVQTFYERLGYRVDELIFMEKWL